MTMKNLKKLVNQALAHHDKQHYERAETLFLEALYQMDNKENELYQQIVYGLGINYSRQENYDGAKRCFEEGRLNAQKAENIPFELEMLHQLVQLSRITKDYEGTAVLVNEELLYRKQHAPMDMLGFAATHYENGLNYLNWERYELSEKQLELALNYAEKEPEANNTVLAKIHQTLRTVQEMRKDQ